MSSACATRPRRSVLRREGGAAGRPGPLVELGLLALLYALYSVSRVLVGPEPEQATVNAELVLQLERLVGLDVEASAIAWVVDSTVLSVAAGYAYAGLHYTVTPAVLVWLYRRHHDSYRRARSVLVATTCLALVCYWLLPTAPPRLLSPDFPDVLALTSQWGWWGADGSAPRGLGSLTNEYAAVPSMHVGWAVWCGGALVLHARRRAVRVAGVLYPLVVSVVVVVTANHYVLDAVAGAALVLAVAVVWSRLTRAPAPA